jgi:gamma-glutamylcyclotransferase (GGCT)/AIG2-like uncharacterized protein YtfP
MPQHLFVYGTLRSEFPGPLAVKLKSRANLIGMGSAPGTLYDFGWYPGAAFNAAARTRVVGEVYALWHDARLMAQLDAYEGIPEPNIRFRRVVMGVRVERIGTVEAWTYELVELPISRRPIESGNFILHLQQHGGRPRRLRGPAPLFVSGRMGR